MGKIEQRRVLLGTVGEKPTTSSTLDVVNQHFRFSPQDWIEPPQQVEVIGPGVFDVGGRPGVVADYKPRSLWGLYNSRPFTVLGAKMSLEPESPFYDRQVYEAEAIFWGAHIRESLNKPEALRLTFSLPAVGWEHDKPVTLDQGRLSSWYEGRNPGLEWESTASPDVHSLLRRSIPILTTMLHLWTGKTISVLSTQVRLAEAGWCTVEVPPSAPRPSGQSFLELEALTLAVVKKWLDKAPKIGQLPYVATADLGPLQVRVQVVATALEGMHDRKDPNASSFNPPLPKPLLKRANRAAKQAAVDALNGSADAAVVKKRYGDALGHVQGLSYGEALTRTIAPIEGVVPALLGPSPKEWVSTMTKLRNFQSHGGKKHDDFGENEISLYYVMSVSGLWVLKILLLLELIDAEQVRIALRRSDQFMFALANIDREQYWENFSAYRTFIHASKSSIVSGTA